jgi:ribosomal protein S6
MVEHIHDDSEIRSYELGFHIVPIVPESDVSREIEAVRSLIESHGGSVSTEDFPALIDLAYPMRKNIARKWHVFQTAYFGWLRFDISPEGAHALKTELESVDHVLRFILMKIDKDAPVVSYVPPNTTKSSIPDDEAEKPVVDEPVSEEKVTMTTEQMDAEIEKLVA